MKACLSPQTSLERTTWWSVGKASVSQPPPWVGRQVPPPGESAAEVGWFSTFGRKSALQWGNYWLRGKHPSNASPSRQPRWRLQRPKTITTSCNLWMNWCQKLLANSIFTAGMVHMYSASMYSIYTRVKLSTGFKIKGIKRVEGT